MQMMFLCDCVQERTNAIDQSELYSFIEGLSEICEVRAVAFKDLVTIKPGQANLFEGWLIHKYGVQKAANHANILERTRFLEYIEKYCSSKLSHYRTKESKFFDQSLFQDIIQIIQSYYKLEPSLDKMML